MTTANHWGSRTGQLAALASLAVAISLSLVTACGSSSGGGQPPNQSSKGTTVSAGGHAIHVFAVGRDGKRRPLAFGPGTEVSAAGSTNGPPIPKPAARAGLHQQSSSGLHLLAGGTQVATPSTPDNADQTGDIMGTAWALVYRAAIQCGYSGPAGSSGLERVPWQFDASLNALSYFIFQSLGATCAERMRIEQTLLCISDKLAEVSDAVGNVVWPRLGINDTGNLSAAFCASPSSPAADAGPIRYGIDDAGSDPNNDCSFVLEWDIPPQADSDRFIVRDLAIHTLGVLATTDNWQVSGCNPPSSSNTCTCSQLYGYIADPNTPPIVDGTSFAAFNVPVGSASSPRFPDLPPSNLPIIDAAGAYNGQTIARSALLMEGQILRAGARLLHDLVRRDAYSDFASASKLIAHGGDPQAGLNNAWGLSSVTPYGTYAHAARVIAGRWEVGSAPFGDGFTVHGDPQCETPEIGLLPNAYGDELSARTGDAPIVTPGETTAVTLVEQAGIAVPECGLARSLSSDLRSALTDQLFLVDQQRNGTPNPTYGGPLEARFQTLVNNLSDSEILFGYAYVNRTFRLLTDSTGDSTASAAPCAFSPGVDPNGSTAGLVPLMGNAVAPSVSNMGGGGIGTVVISGGLPRTRITSDPIARAGGMLDASGCEIASSDPLARNTPWITAQSYDPSTTNNPTASTYAPLPREVFQDAFHMGQAFGRRLASLRAAADPAKGTDVGDPEGVARGALAELRAWAGNTIGQVSGQFNATASQVTGITVTLAGFDYSNFNLPAGTASSVVTAAIPKALNFVYGPPWVAECAANERADCPPNFEANFIAKPTAASVLDDGVNTPPGGSLTGLYGLATPVLSISLSPYNDGTHPGFNPPIDSIFNLPFKPSNSRLYLVLRRDPKDPLNRGRVLAVIPQSFRGAVGIVNFAIAPMQRELLDALNMGRWIGAVPPRIGDLSAGLTKSYCVDGVPRDVFVPLQNELTSDSSQGFENSWKHYLTIAQEAAVRADTLGKDLINQNVVIAERTEAANEKIAEMCGEYGASQKVSVSTSGVVTPPPDDPSLNACLNESSADVVFLSTLPDALNPITSPKGPPEGTVKWIQKHVLNCPNIAGCTADNGACTSNSDCCSQNCVNQTCAAANGVPPDPLCAATEANPIRYDALNLVKWTSNTIPSVCASVLPGILSKKAASATNSFQGAFDPVAFTGMLNDNLFGADSLQAFAAGLQLQVDPTDKWQLSYGDQLLMDSAAANNWPGCLLQGGPAACGALLNANQYLQYERAFRYCPGQDPTLANAGCDGGNVSAESNMIKWRVASALWTLAAAAGGMPAGMFTLPIPVLTTADNQGVQAPAVAFYPGKLVASGSNWALSPVNGATNQDAALLNTLYNIDAAFTNYPSDASQEIPQWYLDLYQHLPPNAKHVVASNSAVVWPNCGAAQAVGAVLDPTDYCMAGPGNTTSLSGHAITFSQLLATGDGHLGSESCAAPWGGDKRTADGTWDLGSLIAQLRAGFLAPSTPSLPDLGIVVNNESCGLILTTKIDALSTYVDQGWPNVTPPPPAPYFCAGPTNIFNQPVNAVVQSPHDPRSVNFLRAPPVPYASELDRPGRNNYPFYLRDNTSFDHCCQQGGPFTPPSPWTDPNWKCGGGSPQNVPCNGLWYSLQEISANALDVQRVSGGNVPAGLNAATLLPQDRVFVFANLAAADPFAGLPGSPANPQVVGGRPFGGQRPGVGPIIGGNAPPTSGRNGTCGGLSDLVAATTLMCAQSANGLGMGVPPPAITSVGSMGALAAWMQSAKQLAGIELQQIYAEHIPTRVVNDIKQGKVGTGNKSGKHGGSLLALEEALPAISTGWGNMMASMDTISGAIKTARIEIQKAQIQQSSADASIAFQRVQIEAALAKNTWDFLSGIANVIGATITGCLKPDPATATAGAATGPQGLTTACLVGAGVGLVSTAADTANAVNANSSLNKQIDALNTQAVGAKQLKDADISLALATLDSTTPTQWANIRASIDNIRSASAKIGEISVQMQQDTNSAVYEAAVGAGADFVTIPVPGQPGDVVPIPLNTVLRRQASATAIRYQRALDDAKALAYMARRAIEQRLGVPLSALATRVGPLDAPASWADDICSLTGVNYRGIETAVPPDAGGQASLADQAVINQFADSFVGDYVAKLGSLVDYFNVQYPSHEGDDTAVLSLRQDLLTQEATCQKLSPNLLVNSGRLDITTSASTPSSPIGWVQTPCSATATKCLAAINGGALQPPRDGPEGPEQFVTGVTWLVDQPQAVNDAGASASGDASGGDAGSPDATSGTGPTTTPVPAGMLAQTVQLNPGAYTLSWWDQGRDAASGNLATSAPPPYVVTVFDVSGREIAQFSQSPFVATGTSSWSPRQVLSFSVTSSAVYYIAFAASVPGTQPGSVAIAQVQLEKATAPGVPTAYVPTSSSRFFTSESCPASEDDLRRAFTRSCNDDGSCYYDLAIPLILNTDALNHSHSPLVGKLAKGNYNYRHINVALNLVGTGVRDCTSAPTPDCFGTGYVEYNLEHDGTSAGISDYNGNVRVFNFGVATVNHGKALATERYITLPVGSDDQSLLAQPGIQHVEMRGRPLDGVYRLRIWDSPALQWSHLKDVQIVLNYRYWSEIVASAVGTGAGL